MLIFIKMNASIKNSTKALLNKLHIFPEEMTLCMGWFKRNKLDTIRLLL